MSFPGDRGDHGDHDNHGDHDDHDNHGEHGDLVLAIEISIQHGISLTRADENGDEDQDDLLPKLLKVS